MDPDEKLALDEQDFIIVNFTLTTPKSISEIPAKAYIDSLHEKNEKSRRDSALQFHDESSDLVKNTQDQDVNDKKLTNLDSIMVYRKPTLDEEVLI